MLQYFDESGESLFNTIVPYLPRYSTFLISRSIYNMSINPMFLDIPNFQAIKDFEDYTKHSDNNYRIWFFYNCDKLLVDDFGFCDKVYSTNGGYEGLRFTDKGIKMHELGGVIQFINMQNAEKRDIKQRQLMGDKITEATISNAEIQKSLKSTNIWIAVSTAVAAVYYCSELYRNFLKVRIDLKSALILLFFGMCIGATILAAIQELARRNKK